MGQDSEGGLSCDSPASAYCFFRLRSLKFGEVAMIDE
jgi:hypothetical protein